MVDITPLKSYIRDSDTINVSFIKNEIDSVGLSNVLNYNFNILDCSKKDSTGMRIMQTIGFPYRKTITETVYIINNYITDSIEKDNLFIKLLTIHNANVEYEKINPPIWYGGEKAKKSFNRQLNKDKETKSKQHKEKGPSAAERKLAAKATKLNSLSINLPIKKI